MFEAKKTKLYESKTSGGGAVASRTQPAFVKAGLKKKAETLSGNGALKYNTTGNPFVDQFGKMGTYKTPRSYQDIEKDCETLWAADKLMAVCFIFFLRMITRVVQLFDGTSTSISQKGAEMRHEGIMRMIWLHTKAPKTFMKNIGLFVSVGSWKDIITMLQYDLTHHGWEGRVLNWNEVGDLLLSGLKNEKTCNLVKKYLPQIKANSACKTVDAQADNMIAKWVCSLLFGTKQDASTYKKYRKLKTSGTAHEWQKLISQKKFNEIDFDKIHGRALNQLVRSKFLKNSGLTDAYTKWIGSDEAKVKYTGFVHELFSKLPGSLSGLPKHEQDTINKQFDVLVDKAKSGELLTNLIVVRDTSASMRAEATGTKMSCGDLGKALALYFSSFLRGQFSDAWIEFNSDAQMHTWSGNTPLEKWYNDRSGYIGNTEFESVLKLFVRLKRQGVAEADFPTGILCISDGEFDQSDLGRTNVEGALRLLKDGGFSKEYVDNFVIALWNLQSNYYGPGTGEKFETYGNTPNVYYFSGYSASIVSFLMTGKVTTAEELFAQAMNQEVLNLVAL